MQALDVTAVDEHASSTDTPGSLLPWLASLWSDLRQVLTSSVTTKEDKEQFYLVEYAASRIGEDVLSAVSLDDLDDRIDAILGGHEVFHLSALLTRVALPAMRRQRGDAAAFAVVAEPVIGAAQAALLVGATPMVDAWLHAQYAVIASISDAELAGAIDAVADAGPSLLTSPDVPVDVAKAMAGGLRAGTAMFAIANALERGTPIEPWLALGIVERLIAGIREHLRLVAALPGAGVPDSLLPEAERLDLDAISSRHIRARAHVAGTLAEARRRLLPAGKAGDA